MTRTPFIDSALIQADIALTLANDIHASIHAGVHPTPLERLWQGKPHAD